MLTLEGYIVVEDLVGSTSIDVVTVIGQTLLAMLALYHSIDLACHVTRLDQHRCACGRSVSCEFADQENPSVGQGVSAASNVLLTTPIIELCYTR